MMEALHRRLREMQWALPEPAQRLLFQTVGRGYDPFTDWNSMHRAVFIHVPRTGGNSISQAIGAPKPHVPIGRYRLFDSRRFDDSFKFAFVRNPWDRLLSAYSHISAWVRAAASPEHDIWAPPEFAYYQDFEAFVLALAHDHFRSRMLAYTHFRSQLDWIAMPKSSTIALDFVGRFERLRDDYAEVTARLGIDSPLEIVNESQHLPYREAYSRKMRDIVGFIYARDIAVLDYRF